MRIRGIMQLGARLAGDAADLPGLQVAGVIWFGGLHSSKGCWDYGENRTCKGVRSARADRDSSLLSFLFPHVAGEDAPHLARFR
jgi:hypothetical protein